MWFEEGDKKKKSLKRKLFEQAMRELDVDDLVSSLLGILKEKTEKRIKKELKGELDETVSKLLGLVHLTHDKKEEEEEEEEEEKKHRGVREGVKDTVKGKIGSLAKKVLHKVDDGKENLVNKESLEELVRSILHEELKKLDLYDKEEKKHKRHHKKKKSDWVERLDDEKLEEAREEIDEFLRRNRKWRTRQTRYPYSYPYPFYGPYRLPYGDVYYGPYAQNYRRLYGRPSFGTYFKGATKKKPQPDSGKKDVYTVENLHLHVDR